MSKGIPIILAIAIAIISYHFFTGWYNIIPWTIFSLLTGYFSTNKKNAIINGSLFGFFLFFIYILIGYKGNSDRAAIIRIVLFSLAFSLVGAIAGIIGALTGQYLKNKLMHRKTENHADEQSRK
jgi:hypothetical protein